MKDTIYREDAIGACAYETIECYEARKAIRALPPADRPQGKWKPKHNGYWTCSECGLSFLFYAKGNFCPNCGADMREREGE